MSFSMIKTDALRNKYGLSATERSVLFYLCGYNPAFPSLGRIATDCGCSTRTIIRAIKKLETLGLLVVNRKNGKSSVYTVTSLVMRTSDTRALGRGRPVTPEHKGSDTRALGTSDTRAPLIRLKNYSNLIRGDETEVSDGDGVPEEFSPMPEGLKKWVKGKKRL